MSINSPDVSYAMAAFLVKIHCLNYPLGIAYSKQPAQIFTGLQHLVMQGSRLSFISKELLRPREPKMLAQSHLASVVAGWTDPSYAGFKT